MNDYMNSGYVTGGYCYVCGQMWYGSHDCQGYGADRDRARTIPFDWSQLRIQSGTITTGANVNYSGSKPLVVCNGSVYEAKDLEEAQSKAEQLAHQHQADAFILKPVKKVSPKREVVTTEL